MQPERWGLIDELFHAAVDMTPSDRGAFLASACKDDAALLAEVEKLIAGSEQAGNFIETPPVLDEATMELSEPEMTPLAGVRIGSYKVIHEIGRGGMGTVYLAARADDEFRKHVAIKVITAGFDHETIIQRFKNERQILAGLDHPNIARLLDGGTTESGAPYFVMEYIEGLTIRDYCDTHRLTTVERLKLFRDVCSAVHFAHQNLVVHRDIKPANILVTEDGAPKLLDFGVAKLLSPNAQGVELTGATMRMMTPEYASPEQARGDTITTASDVYSLGVLLYELLTGHRPYRVSSRSMMEIIEAICEHEPPKPSTAILRTETSPEAGGDTEVTVTPEAVGKARDSEPQRLRRELEGDLDNIVLKAMRKEPQRRYASVEQFSEDIRRYFEHLPVIARKDTLSYLTGKFIVRHRAGVAAAALVVMALVAGAVTTIWQAHAARQARDKAEHRFNQVRKLANAVLFDYNDGIEKLAGSTPIRERMVKDALEYLDNLSVEGTGDDTLQLEVASAYEKVGDVQGNPYGPNLGNQDGALESYRKALSIRQMLYLANRADLKTESELGNGYRLIGDILWAKGENDEALSNYRKALAAFEELVQVDPKNVEYLRVVNLTLSGIAHVQAQDGDFKGALDSYRKCLANTEAVRAADPANRINIRNLAIANLKVGDALMDVTDYAGALTQYEKSIQGLSEVAAPVQNNATASRELGLSYGRIALVLRHLEQYEKAASFNLKAIDKQTQAAAADPTNVQCHFDLAATYGNLGDNYLQMKKLAEAATNIRKGIGIFNEALSTNPEFLQAKGHLAGLYVSCAEVLLAKRDVNGAVENYGKALKIFELEPVRSSQTRQLARTYEGLGNVDLLLANQAKGKARKSEYLKEARDCYQKSSDVWRALDQQGKITDEDITTPGKITQKVEQCNAALTRLETHP